MNKMELRFIEMRYRANNMGYSSINGDFNKKEVKMANKLTIFCNNQRKVGLIKEVQNVLLL